MKIVIDITKEQYEIIKELVKKQNCICPEADSAEKIILNGTPLPKGHGRLIDADKYLKSVCTYKETGCGSCKLQTTCPADAPTIIEADKESEKDE